MHHTRPRRGGTSPPDDAALVQLFQRLCRRQGSEASATIAFPALAQSQDGATAGTRHALAVTTKHALAHEVRETERIMHQNTISNNSLHVSGDFESSTETTSCKIPVLQDLEELMSELYQVYDREEVEGELSMQEREYAGALQQAVGVALAHAALAKGSSNNNKTSDLHDPLYMGEVRVRLLEMVVRPSALSCQLAFTLFLNLSVNVTVIGLTAIAPATAGQRLAEQTQTRLFHVLVEMLNKAVVVASSSVKEPKRSSHRDHQWIAQAVGCLLLFVKQTSGCGEHFRTDRLRALDPQILRFFHKESSQSERNGDLEDQLLQLLVATMYAQEADIVNLAAPSTKTQRQSPVRLALSLTALEHFGGLDMLLFHYYNTPSLHARRLLFMVFFDVACQQQRLKSSSEQQDDDDLWRLVTSWDLAIHLAVTPGLFSCSSSTRVVKKLYTSTASPELTHQLSEKHVQQFVNQLRLLVHVDEYFAESSSLGNTLQLLHNQEKHDVTDALMAKVAQLLGSSRLEDKFQAERWLAELVTYGSSDGNGGALGSGSVTLRSNNSAHSAHEDSDPLGESVIFTGSENDLESSTDHFAPKQTSDELEETCCFDEDASIRLAARSKFWVLAKSPSAAHRESFVRTLTIFVKRKLNAQLQHPSDLIGIAREINICLAVVVQQRETNQRVLVPLLLLIIEVCKCDVPYRDHRKQRYDQQCAVSMFNGDNTTGSRSGLDSHVSRFLEGEIALDTALIGEFLPAFFLHVLSVLQTQSHPRRHCQQRCCGTVATSPLVGDLQTTIALILTNSGAEGSAASKPGENSIQTLLPLMEACDTRVAVIMAKLVVSKLKHSDNNQFSEILNELHAEAVESDDEARLALSVLLADALLTKWVH